MVKVMRYYSELLAEFDGRCAYCRTSLLSGSVTVDHFRPKSTFPSLLGEPSNLLPACMACNRAKGARFPVSDNGEPLLLNPRVDDFNDHLGLNPDGTLAPLSERGAETIAVLDLNRDDLVSRRRAEQIGLAYFAEFDSNRPNPYSVLVSSLAMIRQFNATAIGGVQTLSEQQHTYLRAMLYANAIASMEAYLCDTFIAATTESEVTLRKFVETFHDFKGIKITLSEVFSKRDDIEKLSVTALRDVLYHNLPKVQGMYRDALNIEMPLVPVLLEAVNTRHDIVHRNGRGKEGNTHKITETQVTEVCNAVSSLADLIEGRLAQLKNAGK